MSLGFIPYAVKFNLHEVDATAAGTILLALITVVLAGIAVVQLIQSRKDRKVADDALAAATYQAQISERQAETAEKALQAQMRPLLIEVPIDRARVDRFRFGSDNTDSLKTVGELYVDSSRSTATGNEVRLAVPFLNAGNGVARIQCAWIEVEGQGYECGGFVRANVPVGLETRALFAFGEENPGYQPVKALIDTHADISVGIRYCDAAGRQITTTAFTLSHHGAQEPEWEVNVIDLRDPDADEHLPPGVTGWGAPPAE